MSLNDEVLKLFMERRLVHMVLGWLCVLGCRIEIGEIWDGDIGRTLKYVLGTIGTLTNCTKFLLLSYIIAGNKGNHKDCP